MKVWQRWHNARRIGQTLASAILCLAGAAGPRGAGLAAGWQARRWGVADGLPVDSVNVVLQSRDGYLWLATFDGLVRFDGVRFTVFRSAEHPELPSDRLTTLFEDHNGDLWLITEQWHLVRFSGGEFTRFRRDRGLPDNDVVAWHADSEGTLWFGTTRGVARYREGVMEAVAPELLRATILAIHHDSDGTLWLGTEGQGVLRHRRGEVRAFSTEDGLPHDTVQALVRTADGTLWAGTEAGLASLSGSRFKAQVLPSGGSTGRVLAIEPLGEGSGLVVATAHNLLVLRGGQLTLLSVDAGYTGSERLAGRRADGSVLLNAGKALLSGDEVVFDCPTTIKSFLVDHEDSLWLAPTGDGVYRIRRSPVRVLGEDAGLAHENLYPIVEGPPGVIWTAGPLGGLSRISGDTVQVFATEAGLPPGEVHSLQPDGEGGVWLGGPGVHRFDGQRFHRRDVHPGLAEHAVQAIYVDSTGDLWFGSSEPALWRFDGGSWERWTEAEGLPPAAVRVLAEDRDGSLWMGTNGAGLARFSSARFERLTADDGLSSDLVRALLVDDDGLLWVGTENRGLVRVDARDRSLSEASLVVFRRADGLFDDGLHQILDDRLGRLWMSTNRGIFSVERAELEAFARGEAHSVRSLSYTEADGMRHREANGGVQSAGIRASDGRLWFPTQAGAVIIDPGRLAINEVAPPVAIEAVRVRGREGVRAIDLQSGSDEAGLGLEAGERDLEIAYAGLSFIEPERVQFRYRLSPLQSDWVEAGTRRQAIFTNVPPGRYRFEVLAANEDGVWSTESASLLLSVPARFYETTWFAVVVGLALVSAGLGLGLRRNRLQRRRQRALELTVAERTEELGLAKARTERSLRRVEEQAAQLRELDEAKTRFFANISHELRTPLTLVLGPLLDADKGDVSILHQQAPSMRRNAVRLHRMIEQILDLQKVEAGSLRPRLARCDLAALAQSSLDIFSALAERRGIVLASRIPEGEVAALVDRDQIEKILGNLLSNALKFTDEGGRVELGLDVSEGEARFAVSDTGRGIPAEALEGLFDRFYQVDTSSTRSREGMGIGLAFARELAILHGGSIEVESVLGEGSTFTLRLPMGDVEVAGDELAVEEAKGEADGGGEDTWEDIVPPPSVFLPAELLPAATVSKGEAAGAEATASTGNDAGDRRRVLVVDDNADLRVYLRRVLGSRFEVWEAEDGEAGLVAAREALPDLVVADVMMPRMDGFAFGRALTDDPLTRGIPFLFLTARAGEEDVLEGFRSGGVAYVTKPFAAEVLVARVEALLHQQRRLRERLRAEKASRDGREPTTPAAERPASHGPLASRLREIVLERVHEERFGVEDLASAVAMSRSTLFRKLKDEAGISPAELLRTTRLECAAELLACGEGNVSEVAYAVGFDTLAGFSRAYKRRFGVPPGTHLAR